MCYASQADPAALSWELRAPLLLQELLEADASVICLQECNRFGASTADSLFWQGAQPASYASLTGSCIWKFSVQGCP